MGLEFEFAEWNGMNEDPDWTHLSFHTTHDGSVQPSGLEMVTAPMFGDQFISAMTELAVKCDHYKVTVNKTCGTHVHVAALDYDYFDVRRLMSVYAAIESDIFALLPPSRQDNRFCRKLARNLREQVQSWWDIPLDATHDLKVAVLKFITTFNAEREYREVSTVKQGKYGQSDIRYVALNLHSWVYRGTFEYRHWPGTTDFTDMVCWPLLCGWMVETIHKLSDGVAQKIGSLNDMLTMVDNNGRPYFPPFLTTWVQNIRHERTTD